MCITVACKTTQNNWKSNILCWPYFFGQDGSSLGQTVEKLQKLSGENFPREVPSVLMLSLWRVWSFPRDFPRANQRPHPRPDQRPKSRVAAGFGFEILSLPNVSSGCMIQSRAGDWGRPMKVARKLAQMGQVSQVQKYWEQCDNQICRPEGMKEWRGQHGPSSAGTYKTGRSSREGHSSC